VVRQRRLRDPLRRHGLPPHHQRAGLRGARHPAQRRGDGERQQLYEHDLGLRGGRAEVKWVNYSGTMTFDNVADFGPGVLPAFASASTGCTGSRVIPALCGRPAGSDGGRGEHRHHAATLASAMFGAGSSRGRPTAQRSPMSCGATRNRADLRQYRPTAPPAHRSRSTRIRGPTEVAWGPTAATQDQYLYVSPANLLNRGLRRHLADHPGRHVGRREAGVASVTMDAGSHVRDIEWLPDGSGSSSACSMSGWATSPTSSRYDFATRRDHPTDRPPQGRRLRTQSEHLARWPAGGLRAYCGRLRLEQQPVDHEQRRLEPAQAASTTRAGPPGDRPHRSCRKKVCICRCSPADRAAFGSTHFR
jgi:hypothetical protein